MSNLDQVAVPDKDIEFINEDDFGKRVGVDHPVVVDLHGLMLPEAKEFLIRTIDRSLSTAKHPVVFKVITGRGLHSKGGGVLVKEMHKFVCELYAGRLIDIEEDPGNLLIRGLPIRGHFHVKISKGN